MFDGQAFAYTPSEALRTDRDAEQIRHERGITGNGAFSAERCGDTRRQQPALSCCRQFDGEMPIFPVPAAPVSVSNRAPWPQRVVHRRDVLDPAPRA
ncbi:MAG: hypothetical protein R2855_04700 [Thermomicrobiales bacterium]